MIRPAPGPALSLRQDLRLSEGPKVDLAPTWMLYDPVRHRYFQIDRTSFALIAAWNRALSCAELFERVNADGQVWVDEDEVVTFFDFAERNELVEEAVQGWRAYQRRDLAGRSSALMWAVHNYLFIKIPLFRPRDIFERTAALAAPFFTRTFWVTTMLAALLGLYLVSRQWDAFLGTFPGFMSFDGALVYGATILGVKAVHELAHAYTAARYKCHVSSLGIALLVMVPMLYCDVTDSWKLPDRRQRIAIDCAGIAAELVLAVYASLLWVLLPDGLARTAAFLVASTSIVSSIALNLNPFMRFDGYLILADTLNVPNLQSRAFALLRWRLRESLFAVGDQRPDDFAPGKRMAILVYAAAIIVYRAIVYTGIALFVYHAVFKMLGIGLFAIEIGWFIVAPAGSELLVWWRMRNRLRTSRRAAVTAGVVAAAAALCVFPFRSTIAVPAVMEPAAFARVFPASPGQLVSVAVRSGERVMAGQVIATLASPRLAEETRLAAIRLRLVDVRLERRASVAEDKAETLSLETEKRMLLDKLGSLERERQDMALKSPIEGIVHDVSPDLSVGRWIGREEEIALVTSPTRSMVRGYLRQTDLDKIEAGDDGVFFPDSVAARSVPAVLTKIAYSAASRIDIPYLSSMHGGSIPAREGAEHASVPDYAVYPAMFSVERPPGSTVERGVVRLSGRRESVLIAALAQLRRVLLQESGF